jgi:hypothetical protein
VAVREEDTEDGAVSEESIELELGSEIEQDDDKAYEYSEDNDEQEEPSEDSSPEKEVFYKESSKNAARNKSRRKKRQIKRDQKLKPATARIDENHVKMRLPRLYNHQKSRSPSEEDARDKPRSASPKTAEEADEQDTKVPKNKKKNRRQ